MGTIEKAIDRLDGQKNEDRSLKQVDEPGTGSSDARMKAGGLSKDTKKSGARKNVVAIDFKSLAESGIFPPNEAPLDVRDGFRRIKRPLLSNSFGKTASLVGHGNLIMVTSSIPGEGKTFSAINLALSVTMGQDHTVLLVDADIAKSDMTRLLGLENRPGLSDVLLDNSLGIEDVLVRLDVPNLTILPAGTPNLHVPELLASKRMGGLVAELAERYSDRMIIFDTPPLLATSESHLLADLAGQIAFVIKAGDTPQYIVEEAVGMLDNDKAIGLILNQTKRIWGGGYYSDGYYGYGAE